MRTAKPKAIAPLEHAIQKAICEYLTLRGIFHWRANTGASQYRGKGGKRYFVRFGYPGIADIIGILPLKRTRGDGERFTTGVFMAIEVKRGIQKQSPAQLGFEKQVADNGGIYILARSVDDVEKVVRNYV